MPSDTHTNEELLDFDELYERTKTFGYTENEYPTKEVINAEETHKEKFRQWVGQRERAAKREAIWQAISLVEKSRNNILLTAPQLKDFQFMADRYAKILHDELVAELAKLGGTDE